MKIRYQIPLYQLFSARRQSSAIPEETDDLNNSGRRHSKQDPG